MTDGVKYESLLMMPQWQTKRMEIIVRDGAKCLYCKGIDNLEIHHRQYHFNQLKGQMVLPWEYDNKYLITLCKHCHEIGHRLYKVPVFNI